MYCRECGHSVNENAEICTNCGVRPLNGNKFCQSCGTETKDNQELCVSCGAKLVTNSRSNVSSQNDEPSGLVDFAACCFPIVGIVLYFVWRDDKPRSAKSVCKWAVIGFSIGILFYVLMFVLGLLAEFALFY